MPPRLFEHQAEKQNLSRCRDLVPRPTDDCLKCGGPTRESWIGEMALFTHGGYGADRVTVFQLCEDYECRAVRVKCVTEANPRRRTTKARPW